MITVQRFGIEDFKDSDTFNNAQRRNKELTFDELTFIKERAQTIAKIGAKAGGTNVDIKRGGETLQDVTVDGAEPVIGDIEKLDISEGRYFTEAENNNSVRVALVGADIATKLFPFGSPVGEEINIRGIPYKIVGVQAAKGSLFGMPRDIFVQIPLKTYGSNFGGFARNRYLYFEATSTTSENFKDAVDETRTLMHIKRRLDTGEKDNFGIITPDAITSLRDNILGPTFIVIIAVPGIALLVGAIVIMNIMLVSVTERTKEIGIRKSLGARQSDILKQFLFEAATLSAIGGIVGLILAEILGLLISKYVFQTVIPLWAVFVAIGVSALVGIVAGIFPAWKAARLDPIEALRAD